MSGFFPRFDPQTMTFFLIVFPTFSTVHVCVPSVDILFYMSIMRGKSVRLCFFVAGPFSTKVI